MVEVPNRLQLNVRYPSSLEKSVLKPVLVLGTSPDNVAKFAAAALLNREIFNGHEVDLASGSLTLDDLRSS